MPHPVASVLLRSTGALAVVTTLALLPAGASAKTTFELKAGVITVTGDAEPSRLSAIGRPEEAMFQEDLDGVAIEAGPGCTQITPVSVDCGSGDAGARLTADLGGGDDAWTFTGDALQTIDGGPGNDTIQTGTNKDVLRGGPGGDDLFGGPADDELDGGEQEDRVDGGDGSDSVTGGPGRDDLFGGTFVEGGNNNDKLFSRDGEVDTLDCGGGYDLAEVDVADRVTGCSNVDKPGSGGNTTVGAGGPGAPGTGGTGTTGGSKKPTAPGAFTVLPVLTKVPKVSGAAKGKKVRVTVLTSQACKAKLSLTVTKAEAKRRRLGTTPLILGTSASVALKPGISKVITVGVDRKHRPQVKYARQIRASVSVTCTDGSAQPFAGSLPVTFKR